MPLGLASSEQIDDYWSQTSRRKIFYAYPNGAAPVTGLLSLSENEDMSGAQTGWHEERWIELHTVTVAGTTANSPFYDGAGTVKANPATTATGATLRVYVDDGSMFQTDDMLKIFGVTTSGTIKTEIVGRVMATPTVAGADHYIDLELTQAATNITNAAANVGIHVVYMGSAFAEGSRSRTGRYRFPSEIINYSQIHKTAFELTRTALKEPTRYDKTGGYKDIAKSNGIDHMAGIERTFFEGVRRTSAVTDSDGNSVRRGYSGGLKWFLQQWELGSVAAGGAFEYGQANVSAQTDYVTFTNKRIIKLGAQTITKTTFNLLMTRLFERTNNSSWDKLCLCGPEYLGKVAEVFEKQMQFTSLRDEGFDGFNFKLVRHQSNAGEVYYKQHPLFTSPEMRNSAYYIDLGYLKYRPVQDADTDIQSGIQENDADKRKDQWLTECSFEIPYPEAHMYVEDLGGITL
jgi:hypothetical protein